jgi:hypothetical protein
LAFRSVEVVKRLLHTLLHTFLDLLESTQVLLLLGNLSCQVCLPLDDVLEHCLHLSQHGLLPSLVPPLGTRCNNARGLVPHWWASWWLVPNHSWLPFLDHEGGALLSIDEQLIFIHHVNLGVCYTTYQISEHVFQFLLVK